MCQKEKQDKKRQIIGTVLNVKPVRTTGPVQMINVQQYEAKRGHYELE